MEEKIRKILACREKACLQDGRLKRAAVLIPVFKKDGQYHLLFTRRTDRVEHHKGQISFPGGRQDPEDPDLLATALREAEEEMGIRREDVRILGELDDFCTVSDFCVAPFVGLIPYPYPFRPNPQEIEETLEVPLSALLDPRRFRRETRAHAGRPRTVYAYRHGGHTIWGTTASILKQLLDLLPEEEKRRIRKRKTRSGKGPEQRVRGGGGRNPQRRS
jgi:8-oxo-dGTP pyrophosphatase MutT (NUDIX family)